MASIRSSQQRMRLLGIDPEILDGLGEEFPVERTAFLERGQGGEHHGRRVNLEEPAQPLASVAAAETVRAQRGGVLTPRRHPVGN